MKNMKSMKTKIAALLLTACTLAVAVFPIHTLAASDYCQVKVGINQCGKLLTWKYTNTSISYADSHTYGGILWFAKTCNYDYYYKYYEYRCASGHVTNTRADRIETGHDCGK